jgi:hypothetical protein
VRRASNRLVAASVNQLGCAQDDEEEEVEEKQKQQAKEL